MVAIEVKKLPFVEVILDAIHNLRVRYCPLMLQCGEIFVPTLSRNREDLKQQNQCRDPGLLGAGEQQLWPYLNAPLPVLCLLTPVECVQLLQYSVQSQLNSIPFNNQQQRWTARIHINHINLYLFAYSHHCTHGPECVRRRDTPHCNIYIRP